jgi:cyclase
MLRPRIIPCLLVKNGGLVKTVNFSKPKYVGDPINAVRIFNEKEVDELIVLDIDASVLRKEPDYSLIKHLAGECCMPLCYGGGIHRVDQVERIINLGVEKVAISSGFIKNPNLLQDAAKVVGSQSVVVVLDVKKNRLGGGYRVWMHNATRPTGLSPLDLARNAQTLGAGEVVINSINNDGVMKGFDLKLARLVREALSLPMTVLGGAGSLKDICALFHALGIIGAGAGSLFVFKGNYRAVLINYPNQTDKDKLTEICSGAISLVSHPALETA